jgi:hypothetical protein
VVRPSQQIREPPAKEPELLGSLALGDHCVRPRKVRINQTGGGKYKVWWRDREEEKEEEKERFFV